MIGSVKKIMEKGFGFIASDELTKLNIQGDLFFHFSALVGGVDTFNLLQEGQKVSFEVSQRKDGKNQAINVEVLNEEVA